jgi:crotonobetainyl-CoA:carnitine CoA-transferase CaiB-like acyl-CoA transferase
MSGPLAGIRVIDISQVIAGPYGSAVLADEGADVVKVEPLTGEMWRQGGGASFYTFNRGKRSLPLNLQSDEGREIFTRLAEWADVLVENFRPGVMERLKVDYETLKQRNPRLIFVSVTAFGADGPYAHRPGFDPLLQAMTGTERAQGGRHNPPVFLRIPITDDVTGLLQAAAITMALYKRERTGHGEHLNLSLLRSGLFINADAFTRYDGRPERPLPDAGQNGLGPLDRMYECSDNERLFLLVEADEERWKRLTGIEELKPLATDARFLDADSRATNAEALAEALEGVFRTNTASYWLDLLEGANVPSSPVVTGYDKLFWEDVQPIVNHYVVRMDHPERGHMQMDGNLIAFSETPADGDVRATPLLGQHTRELMRELGYNEKAIDRFKATGVTT